MIAYPHSRFHLLLVAHSSHPVRRLVPMFTQGLSQALASHPLTGELSQTATVAPRRGATHEQTLSKVLENMRSYQERQLQHRMGSHHPRILVRSEAREIWLGFSQGHDSRILGLLNLNNLQMCILQFKFVMALSPSPHRLSGRRTTKRVVVSHCKANEGAVSEGRVDGGASLIDCDEDVAEFEFGVERWEMGG